MLAGMKEVHDLHGSGELSATKMFDPSRSIAEENDFAGRMMPVFVRQETDQGSEGLGVLEGGDIVLPGDPTVFAVFVLVCFVDDADFAFGIPTEQIALTAVLLPGGAHRNEDAIHAHIQTTRASGLLVRKPSTAMQGGLSKLLLLQRL